jgi:hypothetical protein
MAYLPERTGNHNTVPGHYQLFFDAPLAEQAITTDHRSLEQRWPYHSARLNSA